MCRRWRRTRVADDLDIPPRSVVTLQLADVAQGHACPPHHWGLCPCTPGEGCPGWQRLPVEVSEHIPSLTVLAPPASMWLRACRPGQGHSGCIPLYLPSLPFLSHPLLSPLTSQRKSFPSACSRGCFVGETQLTLRHAFKSQPAPHPWGPQEWISLPSSIFAPELGDPPTYFQVITEMDSYFRGTPGPEPAVGSRAQQSVVPGLPLRLVATWEEGGRRQRRE